jgi:hypothetical protein
MSSTHRSMIGVAVLSIAVFLGATQASDLAHKKAALQKACTAGALSADECQQRMAALNASSTPQSANAASPPAAGGKLYHDPQGRFSLTIPAGWAIDTSAQNLKITKGDAWANFNTDYQTGGPLAVAQSTAEKMEQFMSEPKVLNQGNFTAAGKYPAAGVTLGCTISTKSGPAHRIMLFNAIAAGNDNYVVMTSSADYDSGRPINAALAQAIESIHF